MKNNVFQMPKPKRTGLQKHAIPNPEPDPIPEEDPMGLIQGREPGSKPEWRFAVALDYWKIQYIYQYEVFDYPFSGSQKIDFWCLTPVLPTPVFIQGDYWHGGLRLEETKMNVWKVADRFMGKIFDPVEVWEHEIPTVDAAIQVAKSRLRV